MTDEERKVLALRKAETLEFMADKYRERGSRSHIMFGFEEAEARAIASMLREVAEGGWRPIPITDEVTRYVALYGGRCRDCADTTFGPICNGTGLPCGERKGIEHVLAALNYGFKHGFLKLATPPAKEEK